MSFYCIAVVGTLCYLHNPGIGADHFEIDSVVMGTHEVVISTANWKVGEELSSDCIGCQPAASLYTKACIGTDCVTYYRHCDDADRPTVCEYSFDKYPPIDIVAKSANDFQEATSIVALVISDDPEQRPVPLSNFSKEAPGPYSGSPLENPMRRPSSQEGSK